MEPGWRRWVRRTGLMLVLAGAVLLGYLGWQLYVSTWLSERTHREIAGSLEEAWGRQQPVVETGDGRAGALLRVPRFGDDFVVPVLEGVDDEQLAAGVGHFPDSQAPGEVGNFAVAGHRITHGEPFADFPSLRVGDEVVVETREATYTYVLDLGGSDLELPFTDGWVVGPRPVNPDGGPGPSPGHERLITLTTCAELFHTDERLVVFGHLVSAEPRVAAG